MGDLRRNAGDTIYPHFQVSTFECNGHESSDNLFPWTTPRISNGCRINGISNEKLEEVETEQSLLPGNEDDEIHKLKWRSLLDAGQTILEKTNSSNSTFIDSEHSMGVYGRDRPKLQDFLALMMQASALPKPEDVFGRRDTISKHIAQCLNSILDLVEEARDFLAVLVDALYDNTGEGIDMVSLRKELNSGYSKVKIYLKEVDIITAFLEELQNWEARLENETGKDDDEVSAASSEDLHLPQQSLSSAEELILLGKRLPIRPKSWVSLDRRIDRAYALRNRIRLWSKVRLSSPLLFYLVTCINDL